MLLLTQRAPPPPIAKTEKPLELFRLAVYIYDDPDAGRGEVKYRASGTQSLLNERVASHREARQSSGKPEARQSIDAAG